MRSGADEVKTATLETIGNLAFARPNKVTFLQSPGLVSWLSGLARGQVGGVSQKSVRVTATRTLAILGELSQPDLFCRILPTFVATMQSVTLVPGAAIWYQ